MTTETDRELLELAAKAAGIEYDAEKSKPHPISGAWWGLWLVYHREPTEYDRRYWNPHIDDGDALRLAVRSGIFDKPEFWHLRSLERFARQECDDCTATRRAITRAAAEIGREMKGQTS